MTIPTNDELGRIAFEAAKASIEEVAPERWAAHSPTWETLGEWDPTSPAAHIAAAGAVRDAVLEGLAEMWDGQGRQAFEFNGMDTMAVEFFTRAEEARSLKGDAS